MSGSGHGDNTSAVEVTDVSEDGICLASHGQELFLSYEHFPWFRGKSVNAIRRVEELTPGHYHWPVLDIDLTDDIIRAPDRFPLMANQN